MTILRKGEGVDMKLIKKYANLVSHSVSQRLQWLLLIVVSGLLLPAAYATDTDGDGVNDIEEGYAGTDINNPNQRPYWTNSILGTDANGNFGRSADGVGDINGDGYGDFIIGTYSQADNPGPIGIAYVYSGIDQTELYSFHKDFEGMEVTGAGDVNNDGVNDFLVSGAGVWSSGSLSVYSGADGTELYYYEGKDYGSVLYDNFGELIAPAGDVDNDGYDDFMVYMNGLYSGIGSKIWVFSGQTGNELQTFVDFSVEWPVTGMSAAGDVNNDGYDDVLISSRDNLSNYGVVEIYSGADWTVIDTLNGSVGGDFGFWMDVLGDIDDDGYDDILIGDWLDSGQANSGGSITLISGVDRSQIYKVYGDIANQNLSMELRAVGDLDGDGENDFVAQSRYIKGPGTYSGIIAFSGETGNRLFEMKWDGSGTTNHFGNAVGDVGDLDGDGLDDLVIAHEFSDVPFDQAGAAMVVLSTDIANDTDLDLILNGADACPNGTHLFSDNDMDGCNDATEDLDDDNDGMPDVWENSYNLDPLVDDASDDPDGDGFTNLDEYNNGTDPQVYDVAATVIDNDIDADSDGDLILQDTGTSEVTIWTMQDAARAGSASQGQQNGYILVGSGDIDRDNDVDLVFNDASGNVIVWIVQDGNKQSAAWLGQWVGHEVVAIADTDSDGDADIITADTSGNINVIDMEDGARVAVRWIGQWAGRSVVGAGDADNDGDADIFMANGGDVMLVEIENGQKVSGRWLGVWSGRTVVGIGDADNDGDVDVYMENSGDVAIVEVENAAKVSARWLGLWTGYSFKNVADLDADGDKDMLLQNGGNGAIAAVEIENGIKVTGRWLGNHAYDVKGVADVDADGDEDIVMQDGSGNIALIEVQSGMKVGGASWLGINTGELKLSP